jgi:hypothetical protein
MKRSGGNADARGGTDPVDFAIQNHLILECTRLADDKAYLVK